MQIRNRMSRRAIATLFIASLAGCASDDFGTLHASLDPVSGRTVYEYVTPCYVSRTYTPWGTPIKKEGPQRNLIRFMDGGVKSLPGLNACRGEITAEGILEPIPDSCPKLVSPEWCVDE